jgi:H+/Cl- antiporter ClcA
MLGTLALPLVLPTLLMSTTATAVAWIFLGNRPLYHLGHYGFHPSQLVYAALIGPVAGLAGAGWTRLIGAANRARPSGWGRWVAPFAAFGLLALLSLQYPQLLGNGRGIVQLGIAANLSIGLLLILFLLKPLLTAACVASGCPGGLFTPTFAVGVLLAGTLGAIWSHIWPGAAPDSYALIGGGAFLAAAMQGPLAGAVLVLELTGASGALMVPTLIAIVAATIVSRRVGAASIYSARIGRSDEAPTGNAAAVAAIQALDESLPSDLETSPPGDTAARP